MSFLTSYVAEKLGDMKEAMLTAIVAWDPEGATEANIAQYRDNVDKLAALVARAETQAQQDENKVNEIKGAVARYEQAATLLGSKLEAAGGSNAALEKGLEEAMNKLEELEGELKDAEEAFRGSTAWANERKGILNQAGEKLKKAEANLVKARREMERAEQQQERMAERKKDAQIAAGVGSGFDSMDTALDAMQARTNKLKEKARADELAAGAVGDTGGQSDVLAAALAEASGGAPKGGSALDRLKARQAAKQG